MARRKDPTLVIGTLADKAVAGGSLVYVLPDNSERRYPIGEIPLRIGKDPACEIVVEDLHVSRNHAEVVATPDGVIIRDAGSKNGTFVGGVAIKEAKLSHASVVVVGKTRLWFDDGSAANADTGLTAFGGVIGESDAMRRVFQLLGRIAPSELTLTLLGETGTGKDLLSRAVHAASSRSRGPFVVFDCGAVAANLIESELFGHERGAFTGAVNEHQGAFERSHQGTLFLDEVGELPLDLQPRLLRALEQREVRRLGGKEHLRVDVRVIAATNRDLATEVDAGRFREDLYYRLSAAVVHVPALRARREDLPLLAKHILAEIGSQAEISPEAMEVLQKHDWPGNIRELKNVLTASNAFLDGAVMEAHHLMFATQPRRDPTLDTLPLAGRTLETVEKAAIKQTLEQEGGNKTRAAKALGISPSTLYEKIKKYGL